MAKFTRHEIVMNGANMEGKLQRTLVLDNQLSPRHVFKLNKHYLKRLERTSQMAYAADFLIESNVEVIDGKLTDVKFEIYRLTGPCSSAGGRPQLYRIPADDISINMIRNALKRKEFKVFREFLLLDATLDKPLDVLADDTNAVLPKFIGWDGNVGITEEKQSAYVIDLLGGAPVYYAEEMAALSMYSRRQFIMPFETKTIPGSLDFNPIVLTGTPGITVVEDCSINWVIFHVGGGVSIIENYEDGKLISPGDISTALKLFIEPFIDENDERYGLYIEVYSDKTLSPFYQSGEPEEVETLTT